MSLTNYLLVDYENVQISAADIGLLREGPFKVKVFLSPRLVKLPVELVEAAQVLGERVEYVRLAAEGKNAVDFYIAFTIGQISKEDPKAYFHIISKDTGYDSLAKNLKERQKLRVERSSSVSGINYFRQQPLPVKPAERVDFVIERLVRKATGRPVKVSTLQNALRNLFHKSIGDDEIESLLKALIQRGAICVQDQKVSYPPLAGKTAG